MPSVAVRKEVDEDEPVVKANRNLDRIEDAPVDPVACIVEEDMRFDGDARGIDADVLFRATVLPRPRPHLAEQPPMQGAEKVVREDVRATPARRPCKTAGNVGLLDFVQLLPRRDMGEAKPFRLVASEWGRAVGLAHTHGSFQRSAGMERASSSASSSVSSLIASPERAWFSSAM